MTTTNVNMKLPFNIMVLDSEGKLLHLGLPPVAQEGTSLGGNDFTREETRKKYNGWKDTHAFIVRSGSLQYTNPEHPLFSEGKIENCQFVITRVKADKDATGHGDLDKFFMKYAVPAIKADGISLEFDAGPASSRKSADYLYSGECHATVSLAELKEIAERQDPLRGVQFMLKGTQTGNLHREHQTETVLSKLKNPITYSAEYEDKRGHMPDLKTHIPISLITLDRQHWDAGIRIVSSGESGIDERRIEKPVKSRLEKMGMFSEIREAKKDIELENKDDNQRPSHH